MYRPLFTIVLSLQLLWIPICTADEYTAAIDYGFGPLSIRVDGEGDTLTRCQNVDISLDGGFGPYKLGKHCP
jgi:hypothetical protein